MHRTVSLAASLAALLAAPASAQVNATLSLQVSGQTRSCVIHVPAGVSKAPVVFFVHGAGGSGANFRNETKGDATADREKFIAAYPSASSTGASGTWEDMRGTGNFPFFRAVLDTLDKRYGIDRNRIYMTGFSQGGFISFAAACFFSDIFAAVAPVSGHAMSPCAIKRPVPVYLTYGANEDKVAFVKDADIWQKLDKCPATPTITRPYPASNPNSRVTRVRYSPCEGGSSVIMDSISQQGHQWPSASNLVLADEAWAFFKQYSLDPATGVREPAAGREVRGRIAATYARGRVRLDGVADGSRIRVSDVRGRPVATATAARGQFAFPRRPGGVYVIAVDGPERSTATLVIP